MEDLIKRQREIKEAPDTLIINGIEYRKVVPEKEEPTLTNIIKFWEANSLTLRDENRNYDLYNQDIERLVQMIQDWIPEVTPSSPKILGEEDYLRNDGARNYYLNLVRKFR